MRRAQSYAKELLHWVGLGEHLEKSPSIFQTVKTMRCHRTCGYHSAFAFTCR